MPIYEYECHDCRRRVSLLAVDEAMTEAGDGGEGPAPTDDESPGTAGSSEDL